MKLKALLFSMMIFSLLLSCGESIRTTKEREISALDSTQAEDTDSHVNIVSTSPLSTDDTSPLSTDDTSPLSTDDTSPLSTDDKTVKCDSDLYLEGGVCKKCPAGFSCDGTSKSACLGGTFAGVGSGLCAAWKKCPLAQGESQDPTLSSDRQCRDCHAGVDFSAVNDGSPCVAVFECLAEQYESIAATASTDRLCMTGSVCQAGQYEKVAKTAQSNRQCSACSVGSYTSRSAALSCAVITDSKQCTAVNAQSVECSSRTGATAAIACPAGRVCSQGLQKSLCPAGTSAAVGEGVCTACAAGKYSSTEGAASCLTCEAGKVVNLAKDSCLKASDLIIADGHYKSRLDSNQVYQVKQCEAGKVVNLAKDSCLELAGISIASGHYLSNLGSNQAYQVKSCPSSASITEEVLVFKNDGVKPTDPNSYLIIINPSDKQKKWDIETISDVTSNLIPKNNPFWSDSVGGNYDNSVLENALIFHIGNMKLPQSKWRLEIKERYSIEEKHSGFPECYDETFIELKWPEDSSFSSVRGKLCGNIEMPSAFSSKEFEIDRQDSHNSGDNNIKIKFKMSSDISTQKEGWHIDDIRLKIIEQCIQSKQ